MADTTTSFNIDKNIKSLFGGGLNFTDAQYDTIGSAASGFGSSLLGMLGADQTAAAQKAWQKYSNTMTTLSNAISQDSLTLNEIQYIDASAQQAGKIQKQGMAALGALEASAGAAGVRGNSVSVQSAHITGSAATAEANRQREFKYAMLGFDAQRLNSAMTAEMNKSYSTPAGGNSSAVAFQGIKSIAQLIGAF